jgi:CarD family transcriptional regulator
MNFIIGQKVSYPNHGICNVEDIAHKQLSEHLVEIYSLRVLANNSFIHVPVANAASIGVRPVINALQCAALMEFLAEDFEEPAGDWKIRGRDFGIKLQTGDIFESADVLKKLAFLARLKKLCFREQRLFEKAGFLVVSELAIVCTEPECQVEMKIEKLLGEACRKHDLGRVETVSAAFH